MNQHASQIDQQSAPKTQEESQDQIKACEKFTRDVLKNVLQRLIDCSLLPTLTKIIDVYVTNLKMPKDITLHQLQVLLEYISHKITLKLFSRDAKKLQKWKKFQESR